MSHGPAVHGSGEHTANRGCFQPAGRQAPEALYPVMGYIQRTLIRSTFFRMDHWIVFMTAIRTNNDVEGWHNRFNTRVATRCPVQFLSPDQVHVIVCRGHIQSSMQYWLMDSSRGFRGKKSNPVQGKVFGFWKQYCQARLSASHHSNKCGLIYRHPAHLELCHIDKICVF